MSWLPNYTDPILKWGALLLVVSVPLGIWKMIEITIYLNQHLHMVWK
jgi:hypothetical protein